VTAPCRRGKGLSSRVADEKRPEGRFRSATRLANQTPSPSGAVKARAATAQRLGLDGEHGDGTRMSDASRPPQQSQPSPTLGAADRAPLPDARRRRREYGDSAPGDWRGVGGESPLR